MIVQIQKLERGPGIETERGSGNVNLRSCAVVGKDLVPDGERAVDGGWNPITCAAGLERN